MQAFAAHNGEILAAAALPSAGTAGSVVLTGGHDWQVPAFRILPPAFQAPLYILTTDGSCAQLWWHTALQNKLVVDRC